MLITNDQAMALLPRLHKTARLNWRGHDPDDLVQETMLRLIKTTSEILQGGENALLNYALSTLTRAALEMHRREKRKGGNTKTGRKGGWSGAGGNDVVVVAIEDSPVEEAYKGTPDEAALRPIEQLEAALVLRALKIDSEEWRRINEGSVTNASSTAKVRKTRVIRKIRERARAR